MNVNEDLMNNASDSLLRIKYISVKNPLIRRTIVSRLLTFVLNTIDLNILRMIFWLKNFRIRSSKMLEAQMDGPITIIEFIVKGEE